MSIVTFSVTVELLDEEETTVTDFDRTLKELEKVAKHDVAGYDLYCSEWYISEY